MKFLFSLLTVFFCLLGSNSISASEANNECTGRWTFIPVGSLGFDPKAAYGYFEYRNTAKVTLVFEGTFPRARYTSFIAYDMPSEGNTISELEDFNIDPNLDSKNPFRNGTPIDTPFRSYRVVVKATGSASRNTIVTGAHTDVAIWNRIYDPTEGSYQKTSLPRIFAYDSVTGAPTACPPISCYSKGGGCNTNPPTATPFTAPDFGMDIKANYSLPNGYVGTKALTLGEKGTEVLAIRFRPPTFFDQKKNTYFNNSTDVRYYSVCSNQCLADRDLVVDTDGFVNIIVTSERPASPLKSKYKINYLSSLGGPLFGISFRSIAYRPGFQGAYITSRFNPPAAISDYANVLGDYLFRGAYCSMQEAGNLCGLASH